jgi:hypothetical protein
MRPKILRLRIIGILQRKQKNVRSNSPARPPPNLSSLLILRFAVLADPQHSREKVEKTRTSIQDGGDSTSNALHYHDHIRISLEA